MMADEGISIIMIEHRVEDVINHDVLDRLGVIGMALSS